ncbi:FAD:protein FMN transferase [Pontibacter sp. BAB1700]|uniref:FAD:protein FMN transferase n=1 Tax=Pontibacter sp. BAB1700 TaxID=1144253 RepID=UPI00026BBCF0|nr:FAD:protein FMN transferase [Pontibacter sp. BAB1700]EJF11463.1 thiamin biosynthesis lipoprotein [Pontibacter sp. BAB1700]
MYRIMQCWLVALLLVCNAAQAQAPARELKTQKKVLLLMGTRFELVAVSEDEELANKAIEAGIAEIQRIEALISEWQPTSQTSAINRSAGGMPVPVDEELYELIRRSLRISELTGGAFDISWAAADKVWKFDGSMKEMPPQETVKNSIRHIGYQKIQLIPETHSVFLKEEGMKIGSGAIGKGYAANRARDLMRRMGIQSGVVNAAGDLITWGKQADGQPWYIGIADPADKEKVFSWLTADHTAVVTSGSYEKYAEINGKRYGHIIDPRTGYPVSGLKSVTIICPDAELADALATAVFVLGKEEGLYLVNQLKGVECLLVTDENEMVTSDQLHLHYYKNKPASAKAPIPAKTSKI